MRATTRVPHLELREHLGQGLAAIEHDGAEHLAVEPRLRERRHDVEREALERETGRARPSRLRARIGLINLAHSAWPSTAELSDAACPGTRALPRWAKSNSARAPYCPVLLS